MTSQKQMNGLVMLAGPYFYGLGVHAVWLRTKERASILKTISF